jgi:hypothetical protein
MRVGARVWRDDLDLRIGRPTAAGRFRLSSRKRFVRRTAFALRRLTQSEKVRSWRNW